MKTMRDVAQEAGVSRTTVSFVLNGPNEQSMRIAEDTRRRVLEVAESMGYKRNDLVRAVVSGKSRMIGFLGFSARFESAARMLESALDEAERSGYTIKVLRFQEEPLGQATIEQCVQLRLAGVIALFPGERNLESLRREMQRYEIPFAVLDSSLPHSWGIRVVSDDTPGVELAVEHLAALGHRRITFLSGDANSPLSMMREAGYRNAMSRLGLASDVEHTFWRPEGEKQAIAKFMERPEGHPTAILCWDDKVAMIVVRALRERGLRVPDDVSVVGFADLTVAELCDPPLTTVAQPFEEMGQVVVQQLIGRIESKSGASVAEPLERLLPTRLVVRQSTGPVSQSPVSQSSVAQSEKDSISR